MPLVPGRSFAGMRLTDLDGSTVIYGDCDLPRSADCPGELQLQTYTTCARNPANTDLPVTRATRIRGALVVGYGEGRFEVLSGGTNTVVFGLRPSRLRAFVAALRPARTATRPACRHARRAPPPGAGVARPRAQRSRAPPSRARPRDVRPSRAAGAAPLRRAAAAELRAVAQPPASTTS